MALEERVSKLEGAYEQVDARLGDLSRAIESLRGDINGMRTEIRAEMDRRFNTLYLLLGGGWITIMAAIITLAFKG